MGGLFKYGVCVCGGGEIVSICSNGQRTAGRETDVVHFVYCSHVLDQLYIGGEITPSARRGSSKVVEGRLYDRCVAPYQ